MAAPPKVALGPLYAQGFCKRLQKAGGRGRLPGGTLTPAPHSATTIQRGIPMKEWSVIHKGKVNIYMSYARIFTNNIYASNFALRHTDRVELQFSLDCNLAARNKRGNDYEDARELADGEISKVQSVEIHHARIRDAVVSALSTRPKRPTVVQLSILLEGEHRFPCNSEARSNPPALVLTVRSEEHRPEPR